MCCDWYFTGLLNSQVHLIRNLPSLFEPRDYIDILLKPNVFSVHTVSYGTFFFFQLRFMDHVLCIWAINVSRANLMCSPQ